MQPRRAQVLILFALSLPVLLGSLGLAVDGGYFFVASRAVTIAADAAARAAAVDVRRAQGGGAASSYYARATGDGQAVGNANVATLGLTGITFTIEYNDTPFADPAAAGWSGSLPSSSTRAVKATATGTYPTLFLKILGVPSVDLQRIGQGAPLQSVVTIQRVLPLGQCNLLRGTLPAGPWILWQRVGALPPSLCSLLWTGLVDLDGTAAHQCNPYVNWVGPPPTGPGPATGTTVSLDYIDCGSLSTPFRDAIAAQPQQSIVIVDTLAGNRVLGCQIVQLTYTSGGGGLLGGLDTVSGTPVGGLGPCTLLQTH